MNDDFEKKLRALTRATGLPDPTRAWKADILSTARREAAAARRSLTPPPLLIGAWAVAWAAIIILSLSTPRDTGDTSFSNLAGSGTGPQQESPDAPPSQALIALERQYNLQFDIQ